MSKNVFIQLFADISYDVCCVPFNHKINNSNEKKIFIIISTTQTLSLLLILLLFIRSLCFSICLLLLSIVALWRMECIMCISISPVLPAHCWNNALVHIYIYMGLWMMAQHTRRIDSYIIWHTDRDTNPSINCICIFRNFAHCHPLHPTHHTHPRTCISRSWITPKHHQQMTNNNNNKINKRNKQSSRWGSVRPSLPNDYRMIWHVHYALCRVPPFCVYRPNPKRSMYACEAKSIHWFLMANRTNCILQSLHIVGN